MPDPSAAFGLNRRFDAVASSKRRSIPLMRRRLALAIVVLATGCGGSKSTSTNGQEQEDPTQVARKDLGPSKLDLGGAPDDADDSDGGVEPVEIEVTEANRFVKEDLDRFMKDHPDVLRKQDAELFKTCMAEACLEHGASKSLGPFMGQGIRYLVPLWLRGCLSGSADACMQAGRTYQGSQYGDGPTHEGWDKDDLQARFRLYIDRACKLDEAECEQWADFMLGDPSPAKADVAKAIERLKAGCDEGKHGSCAALARHAPDYPAIGDETEYWGKACAGHPKKPNRSCSRYATLMFASGSKADRAEGEQALGGACTPDSEAWKKGCKGDPETGDEVCDFIYADQHGGACLGLAESLKGEPALRITAAMCVDNLLTEKNAQGRLACDKAQVLANELGKSKAYLAGVAKRMCAVQRMECLDETFDLRACDKKQEACEQDVADSPH